MCEHLKYVYNQKSVGENVGVAYGSLLVPLIRILEAEIVLQVSAYPTVGLRDVRRPSVKRGSVFV